MNPKTNTHYGPNLFKRVALVTSCLPTVLAATLSLFLSVAAAYAGSGTWVTTPTDGDWNNAANWSSDTVPGFLDTATFGVSNVTQISASGISGAASIVFGPGADAYEITALPGCTFDIENIGIDNESNLTQNFIAAADEAGNAGSFTFDHGVANMGAVTVFTNEGAMLAGGGAGHTLVSLGGSAGNVAVINKGGAVSGADGGLAEFFFQSTAGTATITSEAGQVSGALGGMTLFTNGASSAGDALVTCEGASVNGALGGTTQFQSNATAGNATLIAEGGSNGGTGGSIRFTNSSQGGTARVQVFGSGSLSIAGHNTTAVTIGSLEGDGAVFLGTNGLVVGSNNLSTAYSGVIQNTGSLTKTGTGTLTLAGANTYSGTTNLSAGALLAANTSGSATGTGAVKANTGTLGGSGIISGPVTVGTGRGSGAFLAPAFGTNKQVTLTLQSSLTLQADATYTYTFKARKNQARTDLVIANGGTINNATIALQGQTQGRLKRGLVLTVLSNTSANPISGAFSNLADGAIITVNGNNLQASYHGGDGNDLTLTVVP